MSSKLVKKAVYLTDKTKEIFDLMNNDLSIRIAIARKENGMSQTALSRKIGVSKSAVSQWELGHTKNIKTRFFFPLAEALKIDPLELFYGTRQDTDIAFDSHATLR